MSPALLADYINIELLESSRKQFTGLYCEAKLLKYSNQSFNSNNGARLKCTFPEKKIEKNMEERLYESVYKKVTICKSEERVKNNSWQPLIRQILICSGVWNSFFTTGLCLGAPTVIIPQLRREANSTEAVSQEMASWISSIHGYAAIPWFCLPIIAGRIGRKYPFFFVSIISLISYIVFYFSKTPRDILITEILQAPLFATQITISIIIVTEYSSPKYRGLFLTLKSASFNWGMWVANALGTFFHWRTIAIAGIICSQYNILTTLFWCESPSWLASKYRYEECARAHRWVKGEDTESEKELAELIKSCKEYQKQKEKIQNKRTTIFTRLYRTILDKAFYKPIILCIAILSLYHVSGKLVCSVYAIDIIKKMTSAESTAYMGMLLLDGVTVTGMYIGSGLSKRLKRRTLLLTGSAGGITFLFILALHLFLCKLKLINENKYVALVLLTLFFLFISVGPFILTTSIFYGELMPLRYRTAGMFITGMWSQVILSTTLKTAPLIFRTFELQGAFVFYGTMSILFIVFLYKYLPETKDKTLQEIEEIMLGKTVNDDTDDIIETQAILQKI